MIVTLLSLWFLGASLGLALIIGGGIAREKSGGRDDH